MRPSQLALDLKLDEAARFDNFVAAGNAPLIAALRDSAEPFIHLWGDRASGKSHLLQAVCHAAGEQGDMAMYIPLAHTELDPAVLDDLEHSAETICIDDVHSIAGRRDWEHALFHLFNRARASDTRVLTSATAAAAALPLELPDLRSRLAWGPTFRIKPLEDDEKMRVLRRRAQAKGMHLNGEVARFLLTHASRDLHDLLGLLDRLDEASLREQRRLTIPFVRQFL